MLATSVERVLIRSHKLTHHSNHRVASVAQVDGHDGAVRSLAKVGEWAESFERVDHILTQFTLRGDEIGRAEFTHGEGNWCQCRWSSHRHFLSCSLLGYPNMMTTIFVLVKSFDRTVVVRWSCR